MNLALWIGAGLLAVVALAGGIIKASTPQEKPAASRGGEWTQDVSVGSVKTLSALEILAAWAWSCLPWSMSHRFWCR